MASQEVVRFDDEQITGMTRYAKAYSGSSFFKDAASVEKAFVLISAGSEIGIAPFASITGISLIQGKPVIGAGILAGLVKSHPHYDYRVRRLDDTGCVIAFFQDGEEIGESSFTIDDAKRAGLAGKDVWKNYPRNMFFARAISNGVAFYTPDVTTTRVYVENELDDVPTPAPAGRKPAAATPAPEPSPRETVIEAEIVDAAHSTPVEEPNPDRTGDGDAAASTVNPTTALASVLKGLDPDQRKVVKGRTTLLGIKWDAETPAKLIEHFAGDDEGLIAHIKGEPNAQVDAEVQGADRFQAHLDEERAAAADAAIANVSARHDQLAAAGGYGE